jgi:predicted GH43/DUF377 family glycosyl hydrolase
MTQFGLASRSATQLRPDPSRVISQLFVPGHERAGGSEQRASAVVARVLSIDDAEVSRAVAELMARFAGRHRDLLDTFARHAERMAHRLDSRAVLSAERRMLLGATFTHEYAIEAASVCNPSMVAHPDQRGVTPGGLRFVMSLRGIGEGHLSSIGFRTGTIEASGEVTFDKAGAFPTAATVVRPVALHRAAFHGKLAALGSDGENAASVLDPLGEEFRPEELQHRLDLLEGQRDTRHNAANTSHLLTDIAACHYRTWFGPETELSERVLWPAIPAESGGMEDARFVRFVENNGAVSYLATYTAYTGRSISQQLLRTTDFISFESSPIAGPVAANKGLALFPRRVHDRFAALSRHDRETSGVAYSDSLHCWDKTTTIQVPNLTWDTIQVGNCGSPIETEAGWLVLTHGVGAMRTYCIGAILLDLGEPTRIIARLPGPLLSPTADEQDGYVPNVVYSCGALLHGTNLVIPYAYADAAISVARVNLADLLGAMIPAGAPAGAGADPSRIRDPAL